MFTGKKTVLLLAFLLLLTACIGAPTSEQSDPSETKIATCVILMSLNDDWHLVATELNENVKTEITVDQFETKLRDTMKTSCSFVFAKRDAPAKERLNSRIEKVCRDDLKNQNPYLGNSLHCRQALALQ